MSGPDSISLFSEGTFEEQIQELVNYIARNQSEEQRATFIRPFQDALKTGEGSKPLEENVDRRKAVFSMVLAQVKGVGEGSDKEIEGFFNLLFAHLLSLYPIDSPETRQYLAALLLVISSSTTENAIVKYRVLSNLFNAIPKQSSLRLPVFDALLRMAVANEQMDHLQMPVSDVEEWVAKWTISPEQKCSVLKSIVDAYAKTGLPDISYKYMLPYVRSLSKSSPNLRSAAVDAIAATLRVPSVFDFDPLFKLDAIVAAKDHELYTLLLIFMNGNFAQFTSWEQNHSPAFEKYNLDRPQLQRKIRLLTLASVGFEYIGKDLPYAEIASALQINVSEVEKWVIDVIRTGLLYGKLSQTNQTLHVIRSTVRAFERDHWEALEKRLELWKGGLAGVLEFVSAARKRTVNGGAPAEAQAQTRAPAAAS